MPNAFKSLLESKYGRELFLTSLTGDYVRIYPMPVWLELEEKLGRMPSSHPSRLRFLDRVNYYGQAAELAVRAESVFVGSGIFMKDSTTFAEPADAEKRARAIVRATTHFNDPKVLLEVSADVPSSMKGLAISSMNEAQMLQTRGW